MRTNLLPLLGAVLPFFLLASDLRADVTVLIDMGEEARAKSSFSFSRLFRSRRSRATPPEILSERYEESRNGKRRTIRTTEGFAARSSMVVHRDETVLGNRNEEAVYLIVDTAVRKAYLMVGSRMGLEADIEVSPSIGNGSYRLMAEQDGGSDEVIWIPFEDSDFGLYSADALSDDAVERTVRLPRLAAELVLEYTEPGLNVSICENWKPGRELPAAPAPTPEKPLVRMSIGDPTSPPVAIVEPIETADPEPSSDQNSDESVIETSSYIAPGPPVAEVYPIDEVTPEEKVPNVEPDAGGAIARFLDLGKQNRIRTKRD